MMTYKEAIQKIKQFILTVQAFPMTIEAMERRIPKKPVADKTWSFILLCPCCGMQVADTEHGWSIQKNYLKEHQHICAYCGQALDWSEDE